MKRLSGALLALVLFTLPAIATQPPNTNNDDTCDIATMPAATLLLPRFEVETELPSTKTTILSITNVTNADQVVRVTLWTDYSFPVISFNVYLTGYDVQSLNLFDIIVRGIIAPENGTGNEVSPRGPFSDPATQNNGQFCDRMPGAIDDAYVQRMLSAFLEGVIPPLGIALPGCTSAGNVHENAVGYATIDVVGNCFFSQPNEPAYFTTDIRYDNVLTGEYQQIDLATQSAQINPLVHIRAMNEGGTPQARNANPGQYKTFDRTFYDRYAPAGFSDARQPLPSTFAARWIQGGLLGYETSYKIWREGTTGAGAVCADYDENANLPVREVVVFDEAENPVAGTLTLPETSLLAMNDAAMPQPFNGATAGWTYLNLDTVAGDGEATQNWVVVSMQSPQGYAGDFDATALGNGCTPETATSEVSGGGAPIGPAN